jgi:hypothetical protein
LLALENHFLSNHETRTLHIDATLWSFVQGDLSINNYCWKMKGFTDSLADLSVDITNRVLVLNILRRLNKNFKHLHAIFTHAKPSHRSRRCQTIYAWRKSSREFRGQQQ